MACVVLLVGGVLFAMLLPMPQVDALSKAIPPLGRVLNALGKLKLPFDAVHVLFFVGVGGALRLTLPQVAWWRLLLATAILGAVSELLQVLAAGRTPSWLDARDDVLGAAMGMLIVQGLPWAIHRGAGVVSGTRMTERPRLEHADDALADDGSLRGWIAAALRSGRPPPLDASVTAGMLVEAAVHEGVAALLDARLRAEGGEGALPQAHREALHACTRALAARWLLRVTALRRIEAAFAAAGMRVLLLKGSALALWLYPQPYLRMGGDVDLLLEREVPLAQAIRVLAPLGFTSDTVPAGFDYEVMLRGIGAEGQCVELDVHARLVGAPAYAERLAFDDLWRDGQALDGLGPALRALSPVHALTHACLNRALDMELREPDSLKLLYDLRLLAARFSPEAWDELCTLTAAKGVAGICLRSLDDAARFVGAAVPPEVRARLQARADAEPLDYRRLDDWRYMQRQNLRALPNLGARLRWLRQRLLPGASQLRHLYGDLPIWRLWLKRLQRGVGRVIAGE